MVKCAQNHKYDCVYKVIQHLGPDAILSDDQISLVLGIKPYLIREWSRSAGLPVSKCRGIYSFYRWGDVVRWLSHQM